MEVIGSYDKKTGKVEKDFHGQGFIFKDPIAFKSKEGVCYIPELDEGEEDDKYTYADFLRIAGSHKKAVDLFERVDWQHPETLQDEDEREEDEDC